MGRKPKLRKPLPWFKIVVVKKMNRNSARSRTNRMASSAVCALMLRAALTCLGDSSTADVRTIMEKAIQAQNVTSNTSGIPRLTYTKINITDEMDGNGDVKAHHEKTWDVFVSGSTNTWKLISVNGHPPTPAELKLDAEVDNSVKALAGSGRHEDRLLSPDVLARYDFQLLRVASVNGRPAFEIAFTGKNPPLATHSLADRFLNRLSGRIWIDQAEYEVAQADIRLASQLDILGGLVGSLKKVAFTMTRTRLSDGIWLSTWSTGDFEARKLLKTIRIKLRSESANIKPAT